MRMQSALAAVMCVLVAGCAAKSGSGTAEIGSSTSSAPSTTGSASPEARAWMEQFCGIGRELTVTLGNAPRGETRTPEELRSWIVGQLDTGITGVTTAIRRLGELGPSQVDGADRAVHDLTERYSELRELFTSTKDKVVALRPGFTEAELGRIVGESMSMPKRSRLMSYPFEGIQITQAMRDAGDVPVCLSALRRGS